MTPISTPDAPAAIGTYSQAVRAGDTVYLSGQIPLDPKTGTLVDGGIEPQTRQVFENIRAILAAAGASFDDVVSAGVFLADMNDFAKMKSYVEQYRQAVTDARDTMMRSGLDPHKKSGGYKAVEIALRRQIRNLQDIARLLTVDEREPIDETIDIAMKIRDEFIHALFG